MTTAQDHHLARIKNAIRTQLTGWEHNYPALAIRFDLAQLQPNPNPLAHGSTFLVPVRIGDPGLWHGAVVRLTIDGDSAVWRKAPITGALVPGVATLRELIGDHDHAHQEPEPADTITDTPPELAARAFQIIGRAA